MIARNEKILFGSGENDGQNRTELTKIFANGQCPSVSSFGQNRIELTKIFANQYPMPLSKLKLI